MKGLSAFLILSREKILNMQNKVLIKEIFESIQGEGLYIGVNQLFIRFSRCNLQCAYCDTDFKTGLKEYTIQELAEIVSAFKNIHSISLTGAEPLMEADFLLKFLPVINAKIYLETNGTLYENLEKIKSFIDIIAMDIKLPSAAGQRAVFDLHEKFLQAAEGRELFVKAVFDENITNQEIQKCAELCGKYSAPLILQPKMNGGRLSCNPGFIHKILKIFSESLSDVRIIPQIHKFMNVR